MTFTLKTLIKMLESVDQEKKLKISLEGLHSFRLVPNELAVSIGNEKLVSEILEEFKSAVGTYFEGYKGGSYLININTPVHFSFKGSTDEYPHWAFSFLESLFE